LKSAQHAPDRRTPKLNTHRELRRRLHYFQITPLNERCPTSPADLRKTALSESASLHPSKPILAITADFMD
jgi:hypothetical protein